MEKLLIYQTFNNKEAAYRTAALLENNGIIVFIEELTPLLDSNFIGTNPNDPFALKIPGKDFTKADDIIRNNTIINLDEVDKDYLLLSFSNEELIAVMADADEWGIYNTKLAEALLKERNISIPENKIKDARQQKAINRAKPESISIFLIFIGYVSAIMGTAIIIRNATPFIVIFLPGFFAIGTGSLLIASKKTMRDGSQTPYFTSSSRLHGTIMIGLSCIIFIIRILQIMSNE